MKIVITGHTQGLGLAFYNYFQDSEVIGFSRTNGYNIAEPVSRDKILEALDTADIFINNAYNNYDDSQLQLLIGAYNLWKGTEKVIVNISSRYTTGPEQYCKDKAEQDIFCKSKEFTLPYIINLKPGLVDTNRVKHLQGKRLAVEEVVGVLDFALNNSCKMHTITFGHIND